MPLNNAQRNALDDLHRQGRLTGVASAYHKLRDAGVVITKAQISEYMRARPEIQKNRMPHATDGAKNAANAVIPHPAIPLSMTFADTMFLPASLKKLQTKRIYRGIILYIDGLTKYIHLEPASFRTETAEAERPLSETARDGFLNFRNKVRLRSGLPNLHVLRIHTDAGSEWKGAFKDAITALEAANPDAYNHTQTTGSRAASNAMAERCIQSVRRIIYSHHRAAMREFDENDVPPMNRRYDWMDFIQDYEDRYNNRRHSTIRETPANAVTGQPITYRRLQQRIAAKAVRRYGAARIPDRFIPGRTSEASRVLAVGDLVRKQQWKPGGPGKATFNAAKSQKAPAGGNFSETLYRIASTRPAQGVRQTTYRIADLDGNEERGTFIRTQLLYVPESTLDYVSSDDEDDEDDEDGGDGGDGGDEEDGAVAQNARSVDPRPLVAKKHRYRKGDTLHFDRKFFEGDDVVVGGLERTPRTRLGVVVATARERSAQYTNRGRYLYTIAFENGRTSLNVDRLPLDRDPDVTFVREMGD